MFLKQIHTILSETAERSTSLTYSQFRDHDNSPIGNPCCCLLICSWLDAFSSYVADEILKSFLPAQRWGHNADALSVITHTQQTSQTVMKNHKSTPFLTTLSYNQ